MALGNRTRQVFRPGTPATGRNSHGDGWSQLLVKSRYPKTITATAIESQLGNDNAKQARNTPAAAAGRGREEGRDYRRGYAGGERLEALGRPCSAESLTDALGCRGDGSTRPLLGGAAVDPPRDNTALFWESDIASLRTRRPNALGNSAQMGVLLQCTKNG